MGKIHYFYHYSHWLLVKWAIFTKEKVESMDFWLAALLVHAKDAWLVIVGSFLVHIGAVGDFMVT